MKNNLTKQEKDFLLLLLKQLANGITLTCTNGKMIQSIIRKVKDDWSLLI